MSDNRRYTRLQRDYEKLCELEARSPFVDIVETTGTPPEKYRIRFTCKGITKIDGNGHPVISESHEMRIVLPTKYPGERPLFDFTTPVWHPNVGMGGSVCYGDMGDHGWAPSMGLDDLVVRVINMLRYENMGLNSAFNMNAADWARRHQHLFPLDTSQIILPELEINLLDEINIIGSGNEAVDDDLLGEIKIN